MFRIAVCEDEKAQREYLTNLIGRWQVSFGEKASVDTYTSAEQYLFETEGKMNRPLKVREAQRNATKMRGNVL